MLINYKKDLCRTPEYSLLYYIDGTSNYKGTCDVKIQSIIVYLQLHL